MIKKGEHLFISNLENILLKNDINLKKVTCRNAKCLIKLDRIYKIKKTHNKIYNLKEIRRKFEKATIQFKKKIITSLIFTILKYPNYDNCLKHTHNKIINETINPDLRVEIGGTGGRSAGGLITQFFGGFTWVYKFKIDYDIIETFYKQKDYYLGNFEHVIKNNLINLTYDAKMLIRGIKFDYCSVGLIRRFLKLIPEINKIINITKFRVNYLKELDMLTIPKFKKIETITLILPLIFPLKINEENINMINELIVSYLMKYDFPCLKYIALRHGCCSEPQNNFVLKTRIEINNFLKNLKYNSQDFNKKYHQIKTTLPIELGFLYNTYVTQ